MANNNALLVGLATLVLGLLVGATMFPMTVTETVVEQVLVPGEDRIIEVPTVDSRYDYYVERADIATACVNHALANWQEEIVITESNSTYDYDEYIEDGSEFEVEDYPNLEDVRRLLTDVSLSEVDHDVFVAKLRARQRGIPGLRHYHLETTQAKIPDIRELRTLAH